MGKNEISLADNLINIINTARENALKKVNEELISMYWQVIEMKNMGHASMATLYPKNMAERIMMMAK